MRHLSYARDSLKRNNPNRGVDIREIYPYYHIYLDWSIAQEKQKVSTILKIVEDGLEKESLQDSL